MIFNTNFDIRNIWIIVFIIIIAVLLIYMYVAHIFRRKKTKHIRLYSNYVQTDSVTIVEYDLYGQPYINGYQAVLYGHV
jgi:heme/copper-type cytochrome/quinol oxidase subunit 2